MNHIYSIESTDTVLSHHGTKGQKWGIRRYQNSDGSLTDAGRKRYGYGLMEGSARYERKRQKAYNDTIKNKNKALKKARKAEDKWEKFQRNELSYSDKKRNKLWDKLAQERGKANSNYWKQWKDNKTLLKELNMGKTEQEYRKAAKNYLDYVSGKHLSIPMKAVAGPLVRMNTKKGKELQNKVGQTRNNYRYKLARQLEEKGDDYRDLWGKENEKKASKYYRQMERIAPTKKQIKRYGLG